MSSEKHVGQDFSGSFCRGARFIKADMRGVRFFKADLSEADFTSADLRTATLEQAYMRDAILRDAVLANAYFTESLQSVANIEGADFSEALMPPFVQSGLCERADASGVNARTGVATRESLMCPD